MNEPLTPLYYLNNFRFLIDWVAERYPDLMDEQELAFIASFNQLAPESQCLLVRMIGRKGPWFRADKLVYAEIENHQQAADQLIAINLVSVDNLLDVNELASILTKAELLSLFNEQLRPHKAERKETLIEILGDIFPEPQSWPQWTNNQFGRMYQLDIQPIINTLLLLFFGNPYQDLTEFVLQDLGLFRYEQYAIDKQHRVFQNRNEILQYQQLVNLREQMAEVVDLDALVKVVLQLPNVFENPSMERRRARLCNQLAYEFERFGELETALQLYQQTDLPPSRERKIRLLDKLGNHQEAWQLLTELMANPANEHELQIAERMAPRLAKKVSVKINKKANRVITEQKLVLAQLTDEAGHYLNVEEITRFHFNTEDAPCSYAENALLNSLFGLWLWPEMFRSVTGAFSNPFHAAPLDLYHDDFQRNRPELKALWQVFDEQTHIEHIKNIWQEKNGITNHFVHWQFLDERTLNMALQCIPAQHIKLIFQRLLFDLKANRSGFPDLIQFFPATNSYRMIEVKGPGDRIQDNQQRWLNFFSEHNIPAEVCYVSWK